jgi:hypothetical protein
MFIPLNTIISKYNLNIKGILHVGAHHAEEKESYNECNINNVVWIDGNEELIPIIKEKLNNLNSQDLVLNYLVCDKDGEELQFHITNNTQSSSVLDFDKHKIYYPGIDFIKTVTKKAYSLKYIIDNNNINMSNFNMLNLDLQGVELKALKGMGEYLSHIDYIYTEVNNDSIYKDNDLIVNIDEFLRGYKFIRVETVMLSEQWGDALYIRQSLI